MGTAIVTGSGGLIGSESVQWWISDLRAFQNDYSDWKLEYDVGATLRESYEQNVEQWTALV